MILIVDGNEMLYKSLFVQRKNSEMPIAYFLLRQLFKYITMFNPDKIYIAADGGKSWRKGIYPEYKANRKVFRDKYEDIAWEDIFENYTTLLEDIQKYSPIYTAHIRNIEGDDIISYVCRYNSEQVTVISQDKDLHQLLLLPNVQIYSTRKKGFVERDEQIPLIVSEKVKKGDKSDNIPKALTFLDTIRNEILVDLINLPISIDAAIRSHLDKIHKDEKNYQTFLTLYQYKFLPEVYNKLIRKEK